MEAKPDYKRFFGVVLFAALTLLIAACVLPDNRYLRFTSLTDREVVKAGWIFERIHFDPSPIDVVVIGTSHSVFAVDSQQVQQACTLARGQRCATVNFALEHLGRNVHWLLAREVINARKPRLLIVEVRETEYRALHPAFAYLADPLDIVSAPIVINTSYFPDLVRLPLRQASLFVRGLAPGLFDAHTQFNSSQYRGTHWDDTYAERGSIEHPIPIVRPRLGNASILELNREREHAEKKADAGIRLPYPFRPLEYRANLIYLTKLLDLARQQNVTVRFLYLPSYCDASSPSFANLYKSFAPTLTPPMAILCNGRYWLDGAHLNYEGSSRPFHLVRRPGRNGSAIAAPATKITPSF